MRADNSRHLTAAARDRAERTRVRAVRALQILEDAGRPVTFETLAREAGVSRSWLYSQPDIKARVHQLRARNQASRAAPTPSRQRATDASLLRRLEAATQRMRQLDDDNRQLRQALAEALGTARNRRVTGDQSRGDTPEKPAVKIIGPC